uniref:DUF676 domain-containing protein n=1 Tax=Strombidium rassoulzadegani TaxID=1082188 RepID=A0A7S3FS89_9SPIT|mmetsp:Transcript_10560/g.17711  ORF Transcript_10560/g.17711 Transcript_10560/m.17711 type:complete len:468 (+) Transcript_10560:1585-2988(+)
MRGVNSLAANANLLQPVQRPGREQQVFTKEEAQKIATAIVMEINMMAGQLFELLNNLNKLILFKPRRVYKFLSREYQNRIERNYGENILRHVVLTQDFCFPSEDFTGQLNDVVAKKTRDVIKMHIELDGNEQPPVEELNIVLDEQGKKNRRTKNMERYAPLIFEECFVKTKGQNRIANTFEIESNPDLKSKVDPSLTQANYKGMHLFVLSHGFQGTSFDVRIFKNVISIALPDALFLCAQANEQDTDTDIFEMGKKLADEIHQYIRESCPGSQLGRLTFIGHSLGGLIIRAALPMLEKYKDKFHGFLTLCSPHLGYMYKSSKLFTTGMWVLKSWKKSVVLNQLSMSDSKNIEDTVLYQLSKQKGPEWFKHVILVSSYQDQYAPFDSARIQICGEAAKDQKKGNTYIQMVNNILGKAANLDVLYRLDVNFNIEENNLDAMIGRTAHILFLENEELMKMIVSRYKSFFS